MSRMDHNPEHPVSFHVSTEVREALSEIVDDEGHESRSHLLRDLVHAKIESWNGEESGDDDGHVPSGETQRAVYLAALEESNERLRLRDHHVASIAQAMQIGQESVRSTLHDLRRSGFSALMGSPPVVDDPQETFRIKPRPVDPDEWTHRERSDRPLDRDKLFGAIASDCIGHHWLADGSCGKCGATRSEVEPTDECDSCGAVVPSGKLDGAICDACDHLVATDGGDSA